MLEERIARIHAALGRTKVSNLARFPARVTNTPSGHGFIQEFRRGASPEELMNDAFILINNVACLRDHLKKWARENRRDPKKVDETIRSSRDLCIIMDLWNSEKHGGSSHDRGWSKVSPRLDGVDRALTLRTLARKNSSVTVQMGRDGRLRVGGDGTATVETSGAVRDGTGNRLGDLLEIVMRAIEAWERLLLRYEIGRGLGMK